jgi:hypothetical protein
MRMLPRRFLMWGGAAAVASAGFAFMAANTVDASSAGEGTGNVTGYHVSGISYTPINNVYYTGGDYAAAEGVTFTLTALSSDTSADTKPTNVDAYPLNLSGNLQWGHDNGCSIVGTWNNTTGSGTYHCSFAPQVPIAEIGKLAVEANQ